MSCNLAENHALKYVLLVYANESAVRSNPEEQQAAATTMRIRDGKRLITDGPFTETHEQLGGSFLLECQDLDERLRWAEKVPTAKHGSIEVRP